MIPLRVTAYLATPPVFSDDTWLPLDALIAGLLFERFGGSGNPAAAQRAMSEVPLARQGEVFQGSAAFCETLAFPCPAPFRKGLSLSDLNAGLARVDLPTVAGKPGKIGKIDVLGGEYRTTVESYRAYRTPKVYWFGCGDADAVRDILSDLPYAGIGKKRRQGYGQVSDVRVETDSEDRSLSILRNGRRYAMRPIAVDLWSSLYEDLPVHLGVTTDRFPYFNAARRVCAVPPTREVFWKKHDTAFTFGEA